MINRNNKLLIFDNFVIDHDLMKKYYRIRLSKTNVTENDADVLTENDADVLFDFESGNGIVPISLNNFDNFIIDDWRSQQFIDELRNQYYHKPTIKNKLFYLLAKFLIRPKSNEILESKFDYNKIGEFFISIKNSCKRLNLNKTSVDFYLKMVENSINNGQKALYDKLTEKKDVVLKEIQLIEGIDNVIYVDEDDVVQFYLKSNAGKKLKLSWLSNYVRLIPDDVIENKKKFDNLMVFDNYVVLHYDKNDDSTELTAKEKEKAKDPILFGVIKGSTKLYYVGDWVDEYCDLTLDVMLKTIEQSNEKILNREIIVK